MAWDFTLDDFRRQLKQIQRLDLLLRFPTAAEVFPVEEDPAVTLDRLHRMIAAMTAEERNKPDSIDSHRRLRLATITDTQPKDVEKLLTLFFQVRALMRQMNSMSLWQQFKTVTGFENHSGQDEGA